MLFGEARGQSDEEKAAVAYTAINRINDGKKWNGTTLKGVILCPKQYSCFNSNDPNRRLLENPGAHDSQSYGACLRVARNVLEGRVADPTNGATHYFNPRVCQPKWASSPKMTRIGRVNGSAHEFYKED